MTGPEEERGPPVQIHVRIRGVGRGVPSEADGRAETGKAMIDHVILTVRQFERSVAFYSKALEPLAISNFVDYEGHEGHPDLKGFGDGTRAFLWLREGTPDPEAVDVGLVAKSHADVDAFCKAALKAGGRSKEAPRARLAYDLGYYATWVLDPDGHDVEDVHKS